jgi:hypothetical protein
MYLVSFGFLLYIYIIIIIIIRKQTECVQYNNVGRHRRRDARKTNIIKTVTAWIYNFNLFLFFFFVYFTRFRIPRARVHVHVTIMYTRVLIVHMYPRSSGGD